MSDQSRIMVVDANPLYRLGVIQTLGSVEGMEIVAVASSGSEAVRFAALHCPDIVLLDIAIPEDGIETAKAIMRLSNQTSILMLAISDAANDIVGAIDAGAVGYLLKSAEAAELISAVRSIAAGGSFISPGISLRLVPYLRQPSTNEVLTSLTDQEERTLRLVSNGLSNREVGKALGIVEKTVKRHMTKAMAKLGVKNRVEATIIARQGWPELT